MFRPRLMPRWIVAMLLVVTAFAAIAQEPPFGTYAYDGSGHITAFGNDRFLYDEFGRLKSATLRDGSAQTFTYDRYGNILTISTAGDAVVTKPGVDKHTNRITQGVDDNSQPNNVVGTYDARGNLITYPSGSFVYDGLDMMKEATVDGVRRFHIYSATDERVLTIASTGAADWTIRDPNGRPLRRLTQTNGSFAWTEDYIYQDGELLAAAVPAPEKLRHFHLDHLGTPRLVTGNGGAKVAEHHYYPFGAELPSSTIDGEKAKFTGHERDAATLDYMHARFYGPSMGRFMSVDPVVDMKAALAKPQTWNRYAYVGNNPINAVDPDGRLTIIIHGTYSDGEWGERNTPFNEAVSKYFGEPARLLQWNGRNTAAGRAEGAEKLRTTIATHIKPGEKLNIVAHSHGGNVVKAYSQLEGAVKIDTFVALGTPQRSDYTMKRGGVGLYVNAYSNADAVQTAGGADTPQLLGILFSQGRFSGVSAAAAAAAGRVDPAATRNVEVRGNVDHEHLHTPSVLRQVLQ